MDLSVAVTKIATYLARDEYLLPNDEALRTIVKALGTTEEKLRDAEYELQGIHQEAARAKHLMDSNGFAPYTARGVVMVLVDKLLNAEARLAEANAKIERERSKRVEAELRGLDGFSKRMFVRQDTYDIRLPKPLPPLSLLIARPDEPPCPSFEERVFRRRLDLDGPNGPAVYVEVP